MKLFKLFRGFIALLLLGLLSACSHVSQTEVQTVSVDTASDTHEGLSEDAKGAILGGTIGATPGMIALGLAAAGTCSNPFTIAVCPLALGLAVGLTATGGAAGAYLGYHAKTTSDYKAGDAGNQQATAVSESTLVANDTVVQSLEENETIQADVKTAASTANAVTATLAAGEKTYSEPAAGITDTTLGPDDINAYLFFKSEEKIFASIKKIAGIFNREAE